MYHYAPKIYNRSIKGPEIPTNTCPYFDFVLEIPKELKKSRRPEIGEK